LARPMEAPLACQMARHLVQPKEGLKARPKEEMNSRPMVRHLASPKEELKAPR
jgi:hypothetical protein